MSENKTDAPIQYGHVAEAIAKYFLGAEAQWIGGRNPGYDLVIDGVKIDVKSGRRARSIFQSGAQPEDSIGIHLNKGIEGLQDQAVDEILVVVSDRNCDSVSKVSMDGETAHVELSVKVNGVAIYRVPVEDVGKCFSQPFKRDGSHRVSVQNVFASTGELEPYRLLLETFRGDGEAVEFQSGLISGARSEDN